MGIIGAVMSGYVTDFFKFREAARASVQSDFEKIQSADAEMLNILGKFSNKALGIGPTTTDDLEALKKNVNLVLQYSEQLATRIPSLRNDFEQYADAMVEMQVQAQALTGPLEGKSFVNAVHMYLITKRTFLDKAIQAQRNWINLS
jgi:hypothetical protein